MMKYHIATKDQAMHIRQIAIGTNINHFKVALSLSVIFQIRAADPENDVGADMMTFSDAVFFAHMFLSLLNISTIANVSNLQYSSRSLRICCFSPSRVPSSIASIHSLCADVPS